MLIFFPKHVYLLVRVETVGSFLGIITVETTGGFCSIIKYNGNSLLFLTSIDTVEICWRYVEEISNSFHCNLFFG